MDGGFRKNLNMALSETELHEGRALLGAAISDPFFLLEDEERPVQGWFSFLTDHFPLATFRRDAYLGLANPDLPTTYPLARILQSVLADEGWQGWDFHWEKDKTRWALEFNLNARRKEFATTNSSLFFSCRAKREEDGEWRFEEVHALHGLTEVEPIMDWDEDGPTGAYSPFEEIGRESVALIEDRDSKEAGTEEAKEAQRAIDRFHKLISARRGRGRPPTGTTDEIMGALYREGTDLLAIIQAGFAACPSDGTRKFLSAHGIDEDAEQEFWATHLALPMLSARELAALYQYTGRINWLSPRRVWILFLAHRFNLSGPQVARRVVGSDEEEEFKLHGDYLI